VNKLTALLVLMISCATVKAPAYEPLFSNRPEAAALPPTPQDDVADSNDPVVGLSKGDPAPFDGVLLGEKKAARVKAFQIRYQELRSLYLADRNVWKAQREVYEFQLEAHEKQIYALAPSWFQQHKFELGFLGGLVLGTTGTIMAVKALH
jgi:hypothetical protein